MEFTGFPGLGRIVSLDEVDAFQLSPDSPDVRGWEVCDARGERIGAVDDLLVDAASLRVRYLDVELDHPSLPENEERHILLSFGYARIDERGRQVQVSELAERALGLPPYPHQVEEYDRGLAQEAARPPAAREEEEEERRAEAAIEPLRQRLRV